MRWIIHVRASDPKQDETYQLSECHDYVAKRNKDCQEVIVFNEGIKSTRNAIGSRKVITQMLEELRPGDNLVVYTLDRLARKGRELVDIYDDLTEKMGVIMHSICQPNHDSKMIFMWAMCAQIERETTSRKTRDKLKHKKSCGEMTGTAPYGWKTDPDKLQTYRKEIRSTGKPYMLIPCPDEQATVGLMVDWHRNGWTLGDIAKKLNEEGATNRKGGTFNKTQVHRVISRLKTMPESLRDLLPA